MFKSKTNADWQRMKLEEDGKTLKLSIRRNFKVKGKDRTWYLGTTRPWTIGIIDKSYSKKMWSPSIDLILDSCFPVNRPESVECSSGQCSSTYKFDPKMLYGSSIKADGHYTVTTATTSGQSSLQVQLRVVMPELPNFNEMFGVYWGIGYSGKKSETYMAAWRGHGRAWVY